MHRLLGRQSDLLHRVRGLRLLFFAAFGSGLGSWMAFVALNLDVWDRTHSGSWIAALLIADFLPAIAIGLTVGPLVDRLSRRRVMVSADVVRFLVFCTLPFAASAGQIVALAAVAGLATGFFRPAVYAGLPNLVEDHELPSAQGLLQAADAVTTVLGPLIGGVLVAATSPDSAYVVNAITFLFSAAAHPPHPEAPAPGRPGEHGRALARHRGRPAPDRLLARAPDGAHRVERRDARQRGRERRRGRAGEGLVQRRRLRLRAAARDRGLRPRLREPERGRRGSSGAICPGSTAAASCLMAIGIGLAAASPNVWIAAACVIVSGVGNGVAVVCNAVLVQRGAPDAMRGRVFTVLMSSNYAVLGLGMVLAGPLTNEFGARWVWGVSACLSAVAAVVGYGLARGIRSPVIEAQVVKAGT